MKKYQIFYIDDQSFALPQLIRAIPNNIDYDFVYVQRIDDIILEDYDIVFLDYYLDKDNKTALDIVERFAGSIIVSFSTCPDKNTLMLDHGAIYAVNKLKNTNHNSRLIECMKNIFPQSKSSLY